MKKKIGLLCILLFLLMCVIVILSIPKYSITYIGDNVREYTELEESDFYVTGKSFFYSIRLNKKQYNLTLPDEVKGKSINVSAKVKNLFGWDSIFYRIKGVGEVSKKLNVTEIKSLTATSMSNYISGDTVDTFSVLLSVTYSDGSAVTLSSDKVEFDEKIKEPLKEGLNTFNVKYKSVSTELRVNAIAKTNINLAVYSDGFNQEMDQAKYKYYGKNICVSISEKTAGMYGSYLLSHIIVNEPSKQLLGAFSNDSYGGDAELCTSCARRKTWKIGVNGSPFSGDNGKPLGGAVFIRDGKIIDGDTTNGGEICMKSDGTLYSPESGISASQLISDGVVQSWGSLDPILISEGVTKGIEDEEYSNSGAYSRTVIGMVKPGEYYIITSGVSGDCGISLVEARNILNGVGCVYARPLGSGDDSSLVFQNGLINHPAGLSEKAVSDFLYFVGE